MTRTRWVAALVLLLAVGAMVARAQGLRGDTDTITLRRPSPSPQPLAYVKFINALPPPILDFSSTFLDVLIDDKVAYSRLEYLFGPTSGTKGGYQPLVLPSSTATVAFNVSFRYSNHPEQGILATARVGGVQVGTYHTVIVFGRNTPAYPWQAVHLIDRAPSSRDHKKIADENEEEIGPTSAFIRYFNAGMSLCPTTVRMNGRNIFTNVSYGQASGSQQAYLEVAAPNTYDFDVVDALFEQIEITSDQLQLQGGCTYTLFAAGVLGNFYSPLLIVDSLDVCA